MASTVLDPVAARLVTILQGLGLSTYKWAPGDLDALPAGVVEMPTITRTPVDEAEDHLGQNDWSTSWPVVLYFSLAEEPQASQATAVETVEAFIAAIDADQDLGGAVQEAKVTEAEPEIVEEESRATIRYVCRVEALDFV